MGSVGGLACFILTPTGSEGLQPWLCDCGQRHGCWGLQGTDQALWRCLSTTLFREGGVSWNCVDLM